MTAYVVSTFDTPRRDIDLFGPTTVRIDRAGVPVLYLSTYVEDPERFSQRVTAALSWIDDTQAAQKAADQAQAVAASIRPAYTMPEFVEDVEFGDVLPLADEVITTDWRDWSLAVIRRIELATTAEQVAALQDANRNGLHLCPARFRVTVGKALNDAWLILQDQVVAA